MRRLDYIPACLNLCPLATFYEEDHNGCQKKKKTNNKKQNQDNLCAFELRPERSIVDF